MPFLWICFNSLLCTQFLLAGNMLQLKQNPRCGQNIPKWDYSLKRGCAEGRTSSLLVEHGSGRTGPSAPGSVDGSAQGAHTQPGWSTPVLPPYLGCSRHCVHCYFQAGQSQDYPWALGDCTHIINVLWILNIFVLQAGIKRSLGMSKDCLNHWEVLLLPRHL